MANLLERDPWETDDDYRRRVEDIAHHNRPQTFAEKIKGLRRFHLIDETTTLDEVQRMFPVNPEYEAARAEAHQKAQQILATLPPLTENLSPMDGLRLSIAHFDDWLAKREAPPATA